MSARGLRGVAPLIAAAALVCSGVAAGCADSDQLDTPALAPGPTTSTVPLGSTLAPPGQSAPGPPPASAADGRSVSAEELSAAASRLSLTGTQDLTLGGDFNARYLTVLVRAIGLDDQATQCAVSAAQNTLGAAFAQQSVGQLAGVMSRIGPSLVPCVAGAGQLPAGAADFSRVPIDDVRGVAAELIAAQLRSHGLEASDATCIADAMTSSGDAAQIGALLSAAPGFAAAGAVSACLTAEEILELGRP